MSNCGHVFCQECLSGYFSSQIQEGITSLTCPGGCNEPVSQRDIEIHVNVEDFTRFDRLQFQVGIYAVDSTVYDTMVT